MTAKHTCTEAMLFQVLLDTAQRKCICIQQEPQVRHDHCKATVNVATEFDLQTILIILQNKASKAGSSTLPPSPASLQFIDPNPKSLLFQIAPDLKWILHSAVA